MPKIKITHSLKLYQPWALDVVEGELPYLVRSFNTHRRGKIGILSTKDVDKIWLENASTSEIKKKLYSKAGIIGSVDIIDVIKVNSKDIPNRLQKLGGKKYYNYYPKHFIPIIQEEKKLYIWILGNAKKWKEMKLITKRTGMQWCKYEIFDE